MKHDYTLIDSQILGAVGAGVVTFTALVQATAKEAERIAAEDNKKPRRGFDQVCGFRIVDRRLQALRKAGKIAYKGGKWELVAIPPADGVEVR